MTNVKATQRIYLTCKLRGEWITHIWIIQTRRERIDTHIHARGVISKQMENKKAKRK